MRILMAASEMVGFAKTGGLADVIGSLPIALSRCGIESAVVLPLYSAIRKGHHSLLDTGKSFEITIGNEIVQGKILQSVIPNSNIPVYLIENKNFFERDHPEKGMGLYQFTENGKSRDYGDNFERFYFFNRAILETIRLMGYWPEILHLNDWQTGLAPLLLRKMYCTSSDSGLAGRFGKIRTLFTIHNIAYQGNFPPSHFRFTGLPWDLFNLEQLEFHGKLSCLKAGLVFADALSTVSPTYSREIQTAEFGCGMEGVLAGRQKDLSGIVNGIDMATWNPASDPLIPANYSADSILPGKLKCKAALQKRFGLPVEGDVPVLGVVARLTEQKGIDLILEAADHFLKNNVQLIVLGQGNPKYHQSLEQLRSTHTGKVGLFLGFDEGLAHQIEAGSDLFLMPSFYEPSGLNQLYSLRYGTPPVVRATGGLADTITNATSETLEANQATGFCFAEYRAGPFLEAINRGLELFSRRNISPLWYNLVRKAMNEDWSWDRSARQYRLLYQEILNRESKNC